MKSLAPFIALLALVLFVPSAAEAAGAPPVPNCSPGGCSGWHNTSVTLTWTIAPGWTNIVKCESGPVDSDTADAKRTCTVEYGSTTYSETVTIKRDTTPPTASASAERGPDRNGWYSAPVRVSASGSDALSGIASCSSSSYSGPDTGGATIETSCRDNAGNSSSSASVTVRYDATAPVVSAAAERAPDGRGWYRKPVTVSFSGTDGGSGIEACTAATRYAGPDAREARIAGTCRDVAGNTAGEVAFALRYDATAPKRTAVKAEVAKGIARLAWKKPADAVSVQIVRSPGVNGRRSTEVFRGTKETFVDRTVRKGVRYRYELRTADEAGNATQTIVMAEARPLLYLPAAGAVVRAPVALAWEASRGARYYNVQLYRGSVKILSFWPRTAKAKLARTWRYGGKSQTLSPGVYRWFVFPARGTPEQPRFGTLLGSSSFRVR